MSARAKTQVAQAGAESYQPPLIPDDDDMEEDQQSEQSMDDREYRSGGAARTLFHAPRSEHDTENSTRSLYDTDIVYVNLHGRRYCGDYFMPNDEEEQTRQQMLHTIYVHLLGHRLTTVPLESPRKILDVGCGTGEWAMEMGEKYPEAEVLGTDLAKIQPAAVPLNVFFEIDDAEEEGGWTFNEDSFDLIHFRGLEGAFTDWDYIYKEVFRNLKPGGWIEVMDFDDHAEGLSYFTDNSDVQNYSRCVKESLARSGRPLTMDHLEAGALTSLGFVDVSSRTYDLPMGVWPEDPETQKVAKHHLVAQLCGIESYSLRPLLDLGWSIDDIHKLCNTVTERMKSLGVDPVRGRGFGLKVKILTGRKPGAPDIGPARRDQYLSPGEDNDGESVSTIRVANGAVNGS